MDQVIVNGMSSCALNATTGVMYLLPSDTYRQQLELKDNWFDCDDWQSIPPCD